MKETGISIVIPVRNREGLVGRTLASVGAQSQRPLAVVLVDNGSTDGTLRVLEEWKKRNEGEELKVTVVEERRPGAAAARNRGLREVETEWVMFFDSDDTMEPGHVERVMDGIMSDGETELVGWDVRLHPLGGETVVKRFYERDALWHCVMHGGMGTQRWAARTDLVRRAGGWNDAVMGWNDVELGVRMLLLNPRIKKIAGEATVDVYSQERSITGTDFSHGAEKWEGSLEGMERSMKGKRERRWVNLRRAMLAGNYRREGMREPGDRLMKVALGRERCPFYRMMLRLGYVYTGKGGRGWARMVRWMY